MHYQLLGELEQTGGRMDNYTRPKLGRANWEQLTWRCVRVCVCARTWVFAHMWFVNHHYLPIRKKPTAVPAPMTKRFNAQSLLERITKTRPTVGATEEEEE